MKLVRVLVSVILGTGVGVVSAYAQQTPQGTYQSSLDSQSYELRARGDNGLDLYSSSGQVIAVMDRRKLGDPYKGKTKALAPTCPEADGGDIEIIGIEGARIRARVEHAIRDGRGQMSCSLMVVIGQSKWTDFSLIRTGDVAGASA